MNGCGDGPARTTAPPVILRPLRIPNLRLHYGDGRLGAKETR
jgi:hypothetical protein